MSETIRCESNRCDMTTANTEDLALCNCRFQPADVNGCTAAATGEPSHGPPHPYSVLERHAGTQSLRAFVTIGNAMCIPDAHKPIPVSAKIASTHVARCTDHSVVIVLS